MHNNTRYTLALSQIRGLGDKTLISILRSIKDVSKIHEHLSMVANAVHRNRDSIMESIRSDFGLYLDRADEILSDCNENNVEVIGFSDARYPRLFCLINDPPPLLYAKGNVELLNNIKSVAVIGTRDATDVGAMIAFKTSEYLADKGYSIVSGLALGIDTQAHRGALAAKGLTVAVLTDVVNIYPAKNKQLASSIVDANGLLFAENPPGARVAAADFVQRDRLQSALSLAVFPIEAGPTSGTMHAVRAGKSQDRLIFCPDVEALVKAGKYNGQEIQIAGISGIITSQGGIPYSRASYSQVLEQLSVKESELRGLTDQPEINSDEHQKAIVPMSMMSRSVQMELF